jgi:hypothetical protein
MKKIIFTLFLFTSFDAYALPDCPDDISATWNNCFGFSNMGNDGDTYEGDGKIMYVMVKELILLLMAISM